jgi:hypothetical protein
VHMTLLCWLQPFRNPPLLVYWTLFEERSAK